MTKGSPDSQHEVIVSAIGRCLKVAYPETSISFGTKVAGLDLKPDIFVDHLNGQRWVYEVVNKSKAITEIEAKHHKYTQSGVRVHWILWQTSGPLKPMDGSRIAQSVWMTDEVIEAPGQYKLNELQRRLTYLGDGYLNVFFVHKPLIDLALHPLLKLLMIGLDIFHFSPEQAGTKRREADREFAPLLYLTFDEHGRPHCESGVDNVPSFLQPLIASFSHGPVFVDRALAQFNALVEDPRSIWVSVQQGLAQLNERYGHEKLPETEEFARASRRFQGIAARMSQKQRSIDEGSFLQGMDALDDLVAALPLHLQSAFREVMPMTGDMLRQMIELRYWFEENEDLHKLLAEM